MYRLFEVLDFDFRRPYFFFLDFDRFRFAGAIYKVETEMKLQRDLTR